MWGAKNKIFYFKVYRGRRYKSWDIIGKTCDLVAPLVLILRIFMRTVNLFGFTSEIKNSFLLLYSSTVRQVIIENI